MLSLMASDVGEQCQQENRIGSLVSGGGELVCAVRQAEEL